MNNTLFLFIYFFIPQIYEEFLNLPNVLTHLTFVLNTLINLHMSVEMTIFALSKLKELLN